MTQSRTSYLPREIVWGQRFVNMIKYDSSNHVYVADYDKYDQTEKVKLCEQKLLLTLFCLCLINLIIGRYTNV